MVVAALISSRRAEVLERWRASIAPARGRRGAPPSAGAEDPVHDPIGTALRRTTGAVVDALRGAAPDELVAERIDEFVRIRSVQELSASDAVRFVLQLRTVLREVLGSDLERAPADERGALEERLDAFALQAFESYARAREKLAELRSRELVSSSFLLLRRARLIEEAERGTRDVPPSRGGGMP